VRKRSTWRCFIRERNPWLKDFESPCLGKVASERDLNEGQNEADLCSLRNGCDSFEIKVVPRNDPSFRQIALKGGFFIKQIYRCFLFNKKEVQSVGTQHSGGINFRKKNENGYNGFYKKNDTG